VIFSKIGATWSTSSDLDILKNESEEDTEELPAREDFNEGCLEEAEVS
jgi:hypothetical protein